jgi:hypothetical protein
MFGMSKALLVAAGGLLAAAIVAPAPAGAQQPTSVTGCLSKGMAKDTFSIQGSDGKSYSLTSTSVKLDQHVGHKVTVTGTAAGMETGALKDTSAKARMDTSMKKPTGAAAGGGTLNVTNLKMVSTQCK